MIFNNVYKLCIIYDASFSTIKGEQEYQDL